MFKFGRYVRVIALPLLMLATAPVSFGEDHEVNLRRTFIVDVVQKTKSAVVYISTTKTIRRNPFGDDPLFARFTQQQRVGSLGSGFIIHKDGYVVTNHHVIAGAREITVELDDGRKLPAQLVSSDPDADLAILKVSAEKPLPVLELGDSSDLMIGEPVIAAGNPLGLSHSVSSGIVSALNRDLKGSEDKVVLHDVIQTDAAINPGNSGGPLLNAYGQVIGINTAIRSDAQNIGFAIQVNRLRDLIPDLMSPEHFTQTELPIKLEETRKLTPPASVAASVQLEKSGEQVISIAGQKPMDIVDAQAILLRIRAGESVKIVTEKGTKTIQATQAGLPDVVVQAKKRMGLTIAQMTPIEAEKLNIDEEQGVLVTAVEKGSIADKAGLQPNDVVTVIRAPLIDSSGIPVVDSAGQMRYWQDLVTGLDKFAVLMKHFPKKGKVAVGIVRPGEQRMGQTILEFNDK